MMGGSDTLSRKAVSVSGAVKNIGTRKLDEIFIKNPYMAQIYPTDASRTALEVFCLYQGHGDFFDLSTQPITRASFAIGENTPAAIGYRITDACNGCGRCVESCPQNCIQSGAPYRIMAEHCLHCGHCFEVCPQNAITQPRAQPFESQEKNHA